MATKGKLEVIGKLKKFIKESGTSKAGKEWSKQIAIVETDDEYNPIVAISAFGEKAEQMNKLQVGMTVAILCNVNSREYNGKYYHNIDGYHFTNQSNNVESNSEFVTSEEEENDLPF
tara:strand:- start:484 stop:834 length:351 start_codon:yes stop_codon:yes gene_type:complete